MNTTIESQFRRFALWNLVISLSLFLPNSSPLLAATVFAQPESLSKEEPQRVRDSLAEFRPEMRRQVVNYHLEQAQHWFDKNDFSKARRELSEALKWDPRNPIGRSLMTRALEEIVIQDRIRREQEKHVAQLIEQDQIREKFLDKVEEMNREMMELTMEGNALYRAGKLQEANQKYQQVLSVQAEKQNVTQSLYSCLQNVIYIL